LDSAEEEEEKKSNTLVGVFSFSFGVVFGLNGVYVFGGRKEYGHGTREIEASSQFHVALFEVGESAPPPLHQTGLRLLH